MPINHQAIMQICLGYTFVGAAIFTVIITCLSLVGWIKVVDRNQQNKLFYVFTVQLLVGCLAFFFDYIKLNTNMVVNTVEENTIDNYQKNMASLADAIDKLPPSKAIAIDSKLPENIMTANSPIATPAAHSLPANLRPAGSSRPKPEGVHPISSNMIVASPPIPMPAGANSSAQATAAAENKGDTKPINKNADAAKANLKAQLLKSRNHAEVLKLAAAIKNVP